MKPSELLTLALDHLAMSVLDRRVYNKPFNICSAVDRAIRSLSIQGMLSDKIDDAEKAVTRRIKSRLNGSMYATGWLWRRFPESQRASIKKLQQWRRAWMLDMIEEWKREGK